MYLMCLDRDQYQLGTLSHLLNSKAHGYQELPEWPEVAPDPGVRNVEVPTPWTEKYGNKQGPSKQAKKKSFYSEDESSEGEYNEMFRKRHSSSANCW